MASPEDLGLEMEGRAYFPLGFPVSREARDRYDMNTLLPEDSASGMQDQVALMRQLAYRMFTARTEAERMLPEVKPGHLLSFCLLADVLRYVFNLYCREQNPGSLGRGLEYAGDRLGSPAVEAVLRGMVSFFPPEPVGRGTQSEPEYLENATSGHPNRHEAVREAVLVFLSSINPALKSFRPLFDDGTFRKKTRYERVVGELETYFDREPTVSPVDLPLLSCLRAPMEASPDSIEGQIDFIVTRWAALLPRWLLKRLLVARDTLREETRMRGFGKGVADVLSVGHGLSDLSYPEPERFTADADWMSNVVLMAKITYVWLHQLSEQYERAILRLDQVPDEELDRLARCGFNSLWLIGLWERSCASEEIKRRMGNPEAAASAYSLYDYAIAADLGGEEAYLNLRDRAWKRGIRLASDMVPNHVGIYSKWVIEHPDWFIQDRQPPFPGYQFTGPNLSPDSRVTIQIEDGYWTHGDAAVVFKRVDNWTGDTRYIYHGNDGTSMPWNDTAQLNYLHPEVREAVAETILHVARLSPVIRFDAAMTLAKKHYQRLWFPMPGDGGAIPSRSLFSMSRPEFDNAFPNEFWREVVDRVQREVPDTLLLAEAFWLMEGYFVRTLGMHRVYNSAFMNMLKTEENLKYRLTVKNVLEFSPEVIKRFVNFMNNPDELTAVEQFGKGDKYFGVTVMMVTMPGLPMFGHGQIEGFTEKYGMEYRRAYWDEKPDVELVRRHEREVFPLIKRRWLFSSSENFAFYDFIHGGGYVDENVFAYTNRHGDERALVLFNNSYGKTHGHIHTSTAINRGSADDKRLEHTTLANALGLRGEPGFFYVFRDHCTGLWYLRSGEDLHRHGLFASLNGYQYHVFLDFSERYDKHHVWARLAAHLEGGGCPDIDRAYLELLMEPLLDTFRLVISADNLRDLSAACTFVKPGAPAAKKAPARKTPAKKTTAAAPSPTSHIEKGLTAFLATVEIETGIAVDKEATTAAILRDIATLTSFEKLLAACDKKGLVARGLFRLVTPGPSDGVMFWRLPLAWAVVSHLEELLNVHSVQLSSQWMEEWLITLPVVEAFRALGSPDLEAHEDTHLLMCLVRYTPVLLDLLDNEPSHLLEEFLEDPAAREYLGVNRYQGQIYVNKERAETLLGWLCVTAAVPVLGDAELTPAQRGRMLKSHQKCTSTLREVLAVANYSVTAALERLAR